MRSEPTINYDCWTKVHNGKEREFFKCKPLTLKLHKRINKLLNISKETAPAYLKSGIKGTSYLKNALLHQGQTYFLLLDIRKFYPSITKQKIKSSLIRTYKQSSDVAEFISNLTTVDQQQSTLRALPTGSPLSQNMAFFINRKMFDELFELANTYSIKMSVYVDDISFSSKSTIPYKFLTSCIHIIKKYGYAIASNKLYYGKVKAKNDNVNAKKRLDITGVQITKYGAFLTASRKIKIKAKRDECIRKATNGIRYDKDLESLLASIRQAILVNGKYTRYLKRVQQLANSVNNQPD